MLWSQICRSLLVWSDRGKLSSSVSFCCQKNKSSLSSGHRRPSLSSGHLRTLRNKKVVLQTFLRFSRLYDATQQRFQKSNVYLLDFSSTYRYHPDLGTDIKNPVGSWHPPENSDLYTAKINVKTGSRQPTVESSSNSPKTMDTSAETSSPIREFTHILQLGSYRNKTENPKP